MNQRNQLIEDAFKKHEDAPSWEEDPVGRDAAVRWHMRGFNDALAVFEGAYTPTDNEREALLSILSDLDYNDGGMMRWSSGRPTDQAEKVADRILREVGRGEHAPHGRERTMMHESHDTIRDGGDGAPICINCACCECHRPEVAAAPCAKARGSHEPE